MCLSLNLNRLDAFGNMTWLTKESLEGHHDFKYNDNHHNDTQRNGPDLNNEHKRSPA